MPSHPAEALAPAQAPNKRQDDFDMAKLQKALKHDQRRSLVSKNKVAKLTPAEIRSLNHSVGLSKSGSVRSVDSHSVHRLASTTPPLTPDNHSSSRRSQSQRRSSAELPTPPLSPDRERRGSASSTRHIHAPKPLSHAQAVHLANATGHSRPSSQTSYRGVATYRGNEITRNNSLTMLQHPSQQIVSNPLSQFSRPRQSTVTSTTSPSKSSSEQQAGEDIVSPTSGKDRTQSVGAIGQDLTRGNSPIRPSDSPVSMEEGEAPDRSTSPHKDTSEVIPVVHVTPKVNGAPTKDEPAEPSAKQKLNWRRTLTGSSDTDPDLARLRKEFRRRTLLSPRNGYCLHAIHYDDTKPGQAPQLRDSLRDELPSVKTSVFKDSEQNQADVETEFGQHPAVRPLSQLSKDTQHSITNDSDSSTPSSSWKGKQRDADPVGVADSDTSSLASSVPSYSRCSCCGRVQKPGGFESELSPVLENENLRTNFSFEVERMSPHRRNRSSSLSTDTPRKYIPIIPMEVGNEMKQARIEPMKETTPPAPEPTSTLRGVAVNKPGDIIGPSSMPLAIMPRRKIDPRVVRFASLHRTKDDKPEEPTQVQVEEPAQNLAPPARIQRFGSLYGLRDESQQQQQQIQDSEPNTLLNRQNSQSAYQAQQVRQQQRSNGNHPLRVSHNAYHEVTLPQTQRELAPEQFHSTPENSILEKPLGDSPVAKRKTEPNSPHSDFSNDGEAMVDLSSFDGSFVHGSLSRSATILRDASPPSTSYGQQQSGEFATSARLIAATSSTSSLPTKINTSSNNSMNGSSIHSAPPVSDASAASRPYAPPLNTNLSDSSTRTTVYKPQTATIVKLIPSAAISVSNSPTSAKGPLRLGDWVLPESPSSQSISSRKGSVQSESLGASRSVAAA